MGYRNNCCSRSLLPREKDKRCDIVKLTCFGKYGPYPKALCACSSYLISAGDKKIIIDIDPTDDPTHGNQQYTLFHGYYYQYMYYPLIVLDGETGDIISSLLNNFTVSKLLKP